LHITNELSYFEFPFTLHYRLAARKIILTDWWFGTTVLEHYYFNIALAIAAMQLANQKVQWGKG